MKKIISQYTPQIYNKPILIPNQFEVRVDSFIFCLISEGKKCLTCHKNWNHIDLMQNFLILVKKMCY